MMYLTSLAKKWIAGVLMLMLLVRLTSLFIGWRMQNLATVMSEQMLASSPATSLYQDLQLTDAQKKQIQALEKQYQSEVKVFCERHCSARMKIAELLKSGEPAMEKILPLQREVCDAYSGSEEATLRHVVRVSEALNPQQKAAFLKKFATSITVSCPMQFVQ